MCARVRVLAQPQSRMHRQDASSNPPRSVVLSVYYVLAGKLFAAPDLGAVVDARVRESVFYMRRALDALWNISVRSGQRRRRRLFTFRGTYRTTQS